MARFARGGIVHPYNTSLKLVGKLHLLQLYGPSGYSGTREKIRYSDRRVLWERVEITEQSIGAQHLFAPRAEEASGIRCGTDRLGGGIEMSKNNQ